MKDYKAALEALNKCDNSGHLFAAWVGHSDAIISALKIADALGNPPTEGMWSGTARDLQLYRECGYNRTDELIKRMGSKPLSERTKNELEKLGAGRHISKGDHICFVWYEMTAELLKGIE